jgi:hypothetical protein
MRIASTYKQTVKVTRSTIVTSRISFRNTQDQFKASIAKSQLRENYPLEENMKGQNEIHTHC